mmetsp:Transcript_37806/g.88812  ORF Transcript_37806/g.88812 Transcript_37806/m.88812 type:complete len:333 (-) Transcript_37806:240-1238(-)
MRDPIPTTPAQVRSDPRAIPVAMTASFGGMFLGYIAHGLTLSLRNSELENLPAVGQNLANTEFWLSHGSRLGTIVPMLFPMGALYILVFPPGKPGPSRFSMQASVTLGSRYRFVLRAQGVANMMGCVVLRLFADELHMLESAVPIQRTNGAWVVCCVCASLAFTFGIFCLFLSRQAVALRWLLVIPLVQCAWSLMQEMEWVLGFYTGPEGDMAGFGLLGAIATLPISFVQLHHFLRADAIAPPEEEGALLQDPPVLATRSEQGSVPGKAAAASSLGVLSNGVLGMLGQGASSSSAAVKGASSKAAIVPVAKASAPAAAASLANGKSMTVPMV